MLYQLSYCPRWTRQGISASDEPEGGLPRSNSRTSTNVIGVQEGADVVGGGSARLFVNGVLTLVGAVLLHLQAFAVVDLALHGDVVAALALGALEGHFDPLVALGHVSALSDWCSRTDQRSAGPGEPGPAERRQH